jgi:hypothetical protein
MVEVQGMICVQTLQVMETGGKKFYHSRNVTGSPKPKFHK